MQKYSRIFQGAVSPKQFLMPACERNPPQLYSFKKNPPQLFGFGTIFCAA